MLTPFRSGVARNDHSMSSVFFASLANRAPLPAAAAAARRHLPALPQAAAAAAREAIVRQRCLPLLIRRRRVNVGDGDLLSGGDRRRGGDDRVPRDVRLPLGQRDSQSLFHRKIRKPWSIAGQVSCWVAICAVGGCCAAYARRAVGAGAGTTHHCGR